MTIAVEVKERPILFSGPMVRAILDGMKTQTRRVVSLQPPKEIRLALVVNTFSRPDYSQALFFRGPTVESTSYGEPVKCPYGKPGDRLWVKENWRVVDNNTDSNMLIYRYEADQPNYPTRHLPDDFWSYVPNKIFEKYTGADYSSKLRPSIFMPRWASRITLEITNVRIEQVQSISERDAYLEGIPLVISNEDNYITPQSRYKDLWESINSKKYPWSSNPWVWVIEFKVVRNG
jgi:hypothetical protein